MGEVIRRGAAKDDILADVVTSLGNAKARGGGIEARAAERLGAVAGLATDNEAKRKAAARAAADAASVVAARNAEADDEIGAVADEYWNAIGRPARDPVYSTILPGGVDTYAGVPVADQPTAMELFATLLESSLETRLPQDQRDAMAARIRAASAPLLAAVETARPLELQLTILGGVRTALGRIGQRELVRLKRQYQADGLSEADIHTIIPDRPTTPPAPKTPTA